MGIKSGLYPVRLQYTLTLGNFWYIWATQLITEPTRITESSSSLIDVIFTNYIYRVVCSGVLHVGISHHSLIYVYRKLSAEFAFKGHATKTFTIFLILPEKTFAPIFLDRIGLVPVMTRMFCGLTGKLNFLLLWTVVLQTKQKVLGRARYLGSHQTCERVCAIAMSAKQKAIKSNDPVDWAVYKRLRNKINGEVKSAKSSYYANAFIPSNGDLRKTWQMINELTSRQKNNASVKLKN